MGDEWKLLADKILIVRKYSYILPCKTKGVDDPLENYVATAPQHKIRESKPRKGLKKKNMVIWNHNDKCLTVLNFVVSVTYKIIQRCIQKKENSVQAMHGNHQLPSADSQKSLTVSLLPKINYNIIDWSSI